MPFSKFLEKFTKQQATASRDSSQSSPEEHVFWKPTLDVSVPVSQEWEHKIGHGDDGWGNQEMQYYTADPLNSFHTPDGKLVIRAINQPTTSPPVTSGRLVSRTRLTHPRGRLSATLSLPSASGVWPAFWLLPSEPFSWPGDGEIDIAETWNGSGKNHSCLHWGFYTPQDTNKHRVRESSIKGRALIHYDFYWDEPARKLVWVIDGKPEMRALLPSGLRPLSDWKILLNVAMGGNVCQGQVPSEGTYDMVVHSIELAQIQDKTIERYWADAPEGKAGF